MTQCTMKLVKESLEFQEPGEGNIYKKMGIGIDMLNGLSEGIMRSHQKWYAPFKNGIINAKTLDEAFEHIREWSFTLNGFKETITNYIKNQYIVNKLIYEFIERKVTSD